MISTACHEDGEGSRKEMLIEEFQGASVRESTKIRSGGMVHMKRKHIIVYQISLKRNETPDYAIREM